VPQDFIFLFFKWYDRTVADRPPELLTERSVPRPLRFLLARRFDKSQSVRSLLAKLREWVPGMPEQDEEVELYEEETPYNVMRLKLDQKFEQAGLRTGDIICIQRASAEMDTSLWWYNTPSLPHHVPAYFRYMMGRRTLYFRPRTQRDLAKLQECLPYIEQSGLELENNGRVVRTKAGEAVGVVLELSCWFFYWQVQQVRLASWLRPVLRHPLQLRLIGGAGEVLTDEQLSDKNLRIWDFLSIGHNPYRTEEILFEIRPLTALQGPRVEPTPPDTSPPVPSVPLAGSAHSPLESKAAEPADDWLEGVEHTARAGGKPKKKGKKGKKGSNKGASRGSATREGAEGSGGGRPAGDLELSDDGGGFIATEAAEPLDELEWLEDTADPAPARKARRKRKKGRKGQGSGAAAADKVEGKMEGALASEGEQSDEDGREEGRETEDRPALEEHGGGDDSVELLESEMGAPAPLSDPAGVTLEGSEAKPPACSSGPADGEQVKSCLTPVRSYLPCRPH
jgi:hypothetical protein